MQSDSAMISSVRHTMAVSTCCQCWRSASVLNSSLVCMIFSTTWLKVMPSLSESSPLPLLLHDACSIQLVVKGLFCYSLRLVLLPMANSAHGPHGVLSPAGSNSGTHVTRQLGRLLHTARALLSTTLVGAVIPQPGSLRQAANLWARRLSERPTREHLQLTKTSPPVLVHMIPKLCRETPWCILQLCSNPHSRHGWALQPSRNLFHCGLGPASKVVQG